MTQTKKLPVDLTQVDVHAFNIIGALRRSARRSGWTTEEIEEMTRRLTVGNYDDLVRVAMEYCE